MTGASCQRSVAPRARLERATYCLGDRIEPRLDLPMPRSESRLARPSVTVSSRVWLVYRARWGVAGL
jgi:hypothetical protein